MLNNDWERAKRRTNTGLGLLALVIMMLPLVSISLVIGSALLEYKDAIMNLGDSLEDDADWDWEFDSDDSAGATFEDIDDTFGGFEEDLDTGYSFEGYTEDDWDWSDSDEDAYDYSTDAGASFDSSFVDSGESFDGAVDSDVEDLFITAWTHSSIYDKDRVNKYLKCFKFYDATPGSESAPTLTDIQTIGETELKSQYGLKIEDLDAYSKAISKVFVYEAVGLSIECVGHNSDAQYTITVWAYDAAEGWFNVAQPFACKSIDDDFAAVVGELIDSTEVDVLLSLAPTTVSADTSANALFNRFDDKVTASFATNWHDWEKFHTEFESWENDLDYTSLAFVCTADTIKGNISYTAYAYVDGRCVDTLGFETEMKA